MSAILGLILGLGLFLVWSACWVEPVAAAAPRDGWQARLHDQLVQAGAPAVKPGSLVGACLGIGAAGWLVVGALVQSPVLGLAFGVMVGWAPLTVVRSRAARHRARMREVWPEVVDSLASGLRAGMALPEALASLAVRGPAPVRPAFEAFAKDYRASGRFSDCLDLLKVRLADPVADRIVEAMRLTRDVGGTDVGRLLRTLSEFLRDDARTRGELEARQSWTVNAARLAVAAPWVVLAMLATRAQNAQAFNSPTGFTVLVVGGAASMIAYRIMMRVGRLPVEARVLR